MDAKHARWTIAVTDHLAPRVPRTCIPAEDVDAVAQVDRIGDSSQIGSGTTGRPPTARGKAIAELTARLIGCSGLLRSGFRFQTGAGATSLAVASALAPIISKQGIVGEFAAGGITSKLVDIFRAGLFRGLWDVQAFDLAAVRS